MQSTHTQLDDNSDAFHVLNKHNILQKANCVNDRQHRDNVLRFILHWFNECAFGSRNQITMK